MIKPHEKYHIEACWMAGLTRKQICDTFKIDRRTLYRIAEDWKFPFKQWTNPKKAFSDEGIMQAWICYPGQTEWNLKTFDDYETFKIYCKAHPYSLATSEWTENNTMHCKMYSIGELIPNYNDKDIMEMKKVKQNTFQSCTLCI